MTTNHEVVAALPVSGDANKALLRALIVGRLPYVLADDEDSQQLVAVDPETGDVVPVLVFGGALFFYDPDDSVTAHDGTTCLVSADSKRFKLSGAADWVQAVLDRDTSAEPDDPSLGDAYLIPAAATGTDWAGHDDDVAVFTARGWQFSAPNAGRLIYVADEDSFCRYTDDGEWVLGIGLGALGDGDVIPSNLLGGRTHFVVENQTTNTPPTPAAGTAYIIGPSPTGAWAGKAGQIAMRDKPATGWLYVTPTAGLTAFDKGQGNTYIYNGSAWISGAGAYVSRYSNIVDGAGTIEDNGNRTTSGTSGYSYSENTPPTASAAARAADSYAPTIAAKKANAEFEAEWWGRVQIGMDTSGGNGTVTLTAIALFVDSESSPRQYHKIDETVSVTGSSSANSTVVDLRSRKFAFTLADKSNHVIKMRFYATVFLTGSGAHANWSSFALTQHGFIIREAA